MSSLTLASLKAPSNVKAALEPAKSNSKQKVKASAVPPSGMTAPAGFGTHLGGSHYYHSQVDASRELAATEAGNLFRTLILDQSHARNGGYDPEKITARTSKQISARTDAMIISEKEQRRAALSNSGFASNPKKAYRPLGQPILDSVELVLLSLMVNPNVACELDDKNKEKLAILAEKAKTSNNLTNRLKEASATCNTHRDYDYIKQQLEACNLRIQMVKFGVPLQKTLATAKNSQRILEEKEQSELQRDHMRNVIYIAPGSATEESESVRNSDEGGLVNWNHLVLNADRVGQVLNHLELRKQVDPQMAVTIAQAKCDYQRGSKSAATNETERGKSGNPCVGVKDQKRASAAKDEYRVNSAANAEVEEEDPDSVNSEQAAYVRSIQKVSNTLQQLAAKANGFGGLCIPYSAPSSNKAGFNGANLTEEVGGTGSVEGNKGNAPLSYQNTEVLESMLNVKRTTNSIQTMENFFEARDNFYEQRNRLSITLQEDLESIDCARNKNVALRFNVFKVSTNLQYTHDIEDMRKFLMRDQQRQKVRKLAGHKWYAELASKLLYPPSGIPKRALSSYEELTVKRLVNMVVNDMPLNTVAGFARLCKSIPPKAFASEDIQRLVRFIKSKEKISEQDYLTALELAGHATSATTSIGNGKVVTGSAHPAIHAAFSAPPSPSLSPVSASVVPPII